MSGYRYGPNTELEAARTVYDKARVQATRIIAEADEQARQIISAAKMRAEREAEVIRENARVTGLAEAEAKILDAKRRRKQEAEARLRAVVAEATGYRRLKDTA
ncbi:hypothetical protein [Glutamicibacter sp. V16R2B1]|uniref:hypothetical protein n=1 Tax=Glutamicibacter sp. V16R2B1 TaxID=2036207 RepID=UPI0010FE18C8|nr:hypothetical protein [Glutamicibacter sp. V16R2B1]TLK56287.1 hypothetical protein FDN03_02220 [Glutamicibacter sp. V16R2B1]